MDTDNREILKETDAGLTDAHRRCIELTKGFERACREPVSKAMKEHFVILIFLIMYIGVLFEPSPTLRGSWIFLIFALIWYGFILWGLAPISTISGLFNDFNKIYYQISSLLEPNIFESEKVLLTLMVTKESPLGLRKKSSMTGGILVLTTHRGFLITVSNTNFGQLFKLLKYPTVLLVEMFNYSSPVNFLKTYDSRNILDRWICKRYMIKTDNSDKPETWHVMPPDGNNYALLEAILEKRDKVK
ncbi:MAG: hypothetical protein NTY09_00500 [bacterium]|nr:hypothetical protein [bacterium]